MSNNKIGKVSFFNFPPAISPSNNIFTEYFDLSKSSQLNKEIEIILPYGPLIAYSSPQKMRPQIEKEHQEQLAIAAAKKQVAKDKEENVTSSDKNLELAAKAEKVTIVFCPKAIANTAATHWLRAENTFKELATRTVSISIGQEMIERIPEPNYYRLPMWCVELFGFCPKVEEIQEVIDQLEAKRKEVFQREKFITLVARRNRKIYLPGARGSILDLLEDDAELGKLTIESAGHFRNNTSDLQEKYNDQLLPYLEQFKFNIVSESINCLGYVSEKLAYCLKAGCIPLYWGDLEVDKQYFNPKALVRYNPSRRMDMIKDIKAILAHPDAFLEEKIFAPKAAELIFSEIYAPLIAKIEDLLNIDLYEYRKDAGTPKVNFFRSAPEPQYWEKFLRRPQ